MRLLPRRTDATQALADGDPALLAAIARARRLLNRRALVGAAAGALPVPGVDWLVDAALLSRLLPAINAEFGLTPDQIARLPLRQQDDIQRAASVVGSMLVGKLVTRDLVLRVAAMAGKSLTARQAAKVVPVAGQAVSAVISYSALRYLGEGHIRDCVAVAKAVQLQLPAPPAPAPRLGLLKRS